MTPSIRVIFRLAGWLLLATPAVVQAQFTVVTNNGAITITGYDGDGGNVVIPDTISGLPVTDISVGAFYFVSGLTGITIPASVTSIGNQAFEECFNLTSLTLGGGVSSIGTAAFAYCSSLTNVLIPDSVTVLNENAFYSCSKMTNVVIGNGLGIIGGAAFEKCSRLANVQIGAKVAEIDGYAFANCPDLASVSFLGIAPATDDTVFQFDSSFTAYVLPGTTGWDTALPGVTIAPLSLPYPVILPGSTGLNGPAGAFAFTVSWSTNATVVVEACSNLAQAVWQPLQTNDISGGLITFSDANWSDFPNRFYRVRTP
jgi:hypothetical protein